MKASEVLEKPGDVAVNGSGDVAIVGDGEVVHMRGTNALRFCTLDEVDEWLRGDDWEPLLTREEWKAAHLEEAAAEWERNCWHRPALNPVGERLTEAPEEGTWVVFYGKHVPDGCVYRWGGKKEPWWDDCRYYLWHGLIPKEPKPKPALPYPERLKVPGVAGIFKSEGGDWYATTNPSSRECNYLWGLGPVLFPYLYASPYSDVAAAESWIDNPAYEGGEA